MKNVKGINMALITGENMLLGAHNEKCTRV
jgi:hypothetical protein